jgi:antibiotic biosynthesis monooxygenase (ABM) superfamily enzyme
MAELHFDNLDDLEAALRSPERAAAYEDGQRLPRFVGEIRRQTFDVLDYVKG